MSATLVMNLSAITESPEAAVTVGDKFSRMAVGLALEGIQVNINIGTVTEEETQEAEETT